MEGGTKSGGRDWGTLVSGQEVKIFKTVKLL